MVKTLPTQPLQEKIKDLLSTTPYVLDTLEIVFFKENWLFMAMQKEVLPCANF